MIKKDFREWIRSHEDSLMLVTIVVALSIVVADIIVYAN